jgi:hypothetical protein
LKQFKNNNLVGIFTNLRRFVYNQRNLKILIFVNKNWPSDSRVGCIVPSNLARLIQTNLGFEEK